MLRIPHAQLRAMTREQLVEKYDQLGASTLTDAVLAGRGVRPESYLEEIARRDAAEQTRAIEQMTLTMKRLTWAIFALTVLNVGLTAWMALK